MKSRDNRLRKHYERSVYDQSKKTQGKNIYGESKEYQERSYKGIY